MPGITCARVSTCAPACIRSATVRPSRAPSTMKSEMMAIASGWLSLTPRSSRRRATMAAIEIRSLSFSRGDRFMRAFYLILTDLIEPQPRQRRAGGAAEHRHHIGAKPRRILGTEAGHCKSVPRGNADFAAERFGKLANPCYQRLIARHDQRGADGHATFCDRRSSQPFADVAVEPYSFRKRQPAAAPHSPAVDEFAMQHALANRRAAEHHDLADQEASAL